MAKEASGESSYLGSGPCLNPDCGSSDAAALYSNGWVKCFSCGKNYKHPDYKEGDGASFGPIQKRYSMEGKPFVIGEFRELAKRGISLDTCKKAKYMLGTVPKNYPTGDETPIGRMKGQMVHIENFYKDGQLIGSARSSETATRTLQSSAKSPTNSGTGIT